MPKMRATPEGRLIEIFDSVDIKTAEVLLGVAKAMLNIKKKKAGIQEVKSKQTA